MAPKDLDNLIAKYLEGKCTKEERDLIDSWYASLGTDPDNHLGHSHTEARSARDRMLQKIQGHTINNAHGESGPSLWRYVGIAASVIVCVAAGFYYLKPSQKPAAHVTAETSLADSVSIQNSSSDLRRIILPDGSLVKLSPGAGVRYPRRMNEQSREILLKGEAYFDVAHDPARPFYVYAGEVITRVMGTSFIIRANNNEEKITVSVKTGKVTVYSRKASHKKTVLTPNQEAVYDASTNVLATQAARDVALKGQDGNLVEMQFEETAVSEVLAALTKAYDVKILFEEEDLQGCVLTSSFFEEGLYDRIDMICTAIGATYKIVDTQIVVESNGCNLKPE